MSKVPEGGRLGCQKEKDRKNEEEYLMLRANRCTQIESIHN